MRSLSLRHRFLVSLSLLLPSGALAQSLVPDERGQAVPDRSFDIQELVLDLDLDPVGESVQGSATYRIQRLGPGDFVLDQVGLEIASVQIGGSDIDWWIQGQHLHMEVELDAAEVVIRYSATPDAGLHFRHSGRGTVDTFDEVWSQGQKNDNRYWIPCWDHPNERFLYEGEIRAPEGWEVLTNTGMEVPCYLIMLAAGEYDVHTHEDDPTVSVYVGPGTSDEAVEGVLGPIPDMKAHFGMRSGVEYPWGPYRQVFAQRFLYGGMENTSATINSDRFLVSDRLRATRPGVERVIAHELAHQWYGDLLTSRTWRELWLNEGFATFMTGDWVGARYGPEGYAQNIRWWFDHSQAPGSMAGRFHQSGDRWSFNVYSKGASVLHMLRVMLGEDRFWAGMQLYTKSHSGGVDTYDLRRAMEEVSGMHLDWFFQQWVELPHVPELTVSHAFGEESLSITVQQSVTDERPLYTLFVQIEVGTADEPIELEGWLDSAQRVWTVELEEAPLYVAFDPRGGILAKIEAKQDPEQWAAQLGSSHSYARMRAMDALAETERSEELVAILVDEQAHEEMRVIAAWALGEQRAVIPLMSQSEVGNARVRQEVMSSLGRCQGDEVSKHLVQTIRRDQQTDVVAAALRGLASVDPDQALKMARTKMSIRDWERLEIRNAAIHVLGEHGESQDLGLLLDARAPVRVRHTALWAATSLVTRVEEERERELLASQVSRFAEGLLSDDDLRARSTAIHILARMGDKQSIPVLESYRRTEGVLRLQKSATHALSDIRSRDGGAPALAPNEIEGRIEALEDRLEALEAENKNWESRH